MKQLLFGLAFLSLTSLGFAQKKTNYAGVPSLVMEAKEKGNAKFADSLAQDYINNHLFKLKEDQLMNKDNLLFISENLTTTDSKAFKLFFNDPEKVNAVLGDYQAQTKVMLFIDRKYLPQGDFKSITKPDWEALESAVVAKFGILGQERIYGQRMIYYWINEDWTNFGIWYKKYYEKGLKHSFYHVNNVSWALFENVEDPGILSYACEVMKYAIDELPYKDHQALDTYANLLYKTGKKDQAIEWEERAIKLSNNDKNLVGTLEKMRKGVPTWTK